jgi:hypothetical protein
MTDGGTDPDEGSPGSPSPHEQLLLWSALVVLAATVGGYFAVATSGAADGVAGQFGLAVLSNLVATLVVVAATYTVVRRTLRAQRDRDDAELARRITGRLAAELAARAPAVTTEMAVIAPGPGPADPIESALRPGEPDLLDRGRRTIVGHILHATSLALVYPHNPRDVPFRTFVHLADEETRTLRPVWWWSLQYFDDYDAPIPLGDEDSPFVIARAYATVRPVGMDLRPDHTASYPRNLRDRIMPDLRCVLAVPIHDYEPGSSTPPLGTISIDSTRTLGELGFDSDEVNSVLVSCAKAVHQVLSLDEAG